MKAFKLMILTAFLVLLGILSGCSPDEKRPVVFADPGWDSVRFHNAVAQLVAERSMDSRRKSFMAPRPSRRPPLYAAMQMSIWSCGRITFPLMKLIRRRRDRGSGRQL